MRRVKTGGGWPAVFYTFRKAREAGGLWKFWKAMRSKNACKTCALGMGGQKGGMVNEAGHFPEVCKKSLQAMAADMQGAIKPEFYQTYSIAQLKAFSPRELEACGRLTHPVILKKGEQYYRPISWDDAMSRIGEKLRATAADESFWYFSGRSSNEAGFLLQMFARLYGTNNVNNCSYYCHQASGVGLSSVLGTGTATLVLDDVEHADLVFVIGGNPASNHPRLMTTLKNVRKRGGEVVVINPIVETGLVNFSVPSDPWSLLFGSKIATLYVQPHIGGDLALLTGVAKRIVEMEAHDESYLSSHTHGWTEWKARLASLSWHEIIRKSGVSREEIDAIAERYARAENAVFSWTMGITHHAHGVHNVEAIANLALLRGMVGRRYAGLMPIRGHSNVQGIGSVGVTPQLKEAIFERLQSHFQVTLPTTPGLDTMACMEAAARKQLKFGFCLGGNLYGSNPDSRFAAESMGQLDMLVYMSTTLNTGHAHGLADETIILPVLARDEEPQPTTQESMFNYIRLSDGGQPRHEGPRSEIAVIAGLAGRVLGKDGPVDWEAMENTSRIREAMAGIIPGWEKIATIDQTKQEFQISGRTFHAPVFATPDGKARLKVHELPELLGTLARARVSDEETQLENSSDGAACQPSRRIPVMTIRSEGQFNTVVYEEYDLYRGIDRRDVILLHPDDIRRFHLQEDARVVVQGPAGRMENILVRAFDKIKPGNAAMYYPEANVLVSRHSDPYSKTPAFKAVDVEILTNDATVSGSPEVHQLTAKSTL